MKGAARLPGVPEVIPRALGVIPRALGVAPRALWVAPRVLGVVPRGLAVLADLPHIRVHTSTDAGRVLRVAVDCGREHTQGGGGGGGGGLGPRVTSTKSLPHFYLF